MGLDLESFKNQISSMRSLVKQSKNHLINKLTREAKKLREKKGTEEQKKKNEKKADRLIEEVMILKKVQPDEVSKFILKTENCNQVMSKPDIPLETKVLARFGTHKILSPVIEKFHTEYPSWKEDMNVLLEQLPTEQKQKVPSLNTSLNCSIVKTAGNNVFSVTPVKQSTSVKIENSSKNNDEPRIKDRTEKQEVVKTKKKDKISLDVARDETFSKHSLSKTNRVEDTSVPKYKSVFDGKDDCIFNSKNRKSFIVDGSSDSDEDEQSDEEIPFSKEVKRPKTTEYSSECSEDEESDGDELSDKEESSDEDFPFIKTDKNPKTDKSVISGQKQSNKGIFFGKNTKNQESDGSKIPVLNHKSIEKINQSFEDNPPTNKKSKQSRLNKDLDEIEQRLNKRKSSSKKNFKDETVVEESVDPFFVTTEGEEYVSSAPIPKTEDRPPTSNFSHNVTPSKEFYRKGKKITPSPHGYQKNFNDRRKSFGNHQDRNNSYHKNDRRNSFNDKFSANNNRRGSFSNKFNGNDDRRSSFKNQFNANSRFNKSDSEFNSRKQDSGSSEHIHPSWEAKKKMSTLAPFQGIKTVFED